MHVEIIRVIIKHIIHIRDTIQASFSKFASPYAKFRMGDNQTAKTIHETYLEQKEEMDAKEKRWIHSRDKRNSLPVLQASQYTYNEGKRGAMIKRLNLRRQDEFKELASVEFRRLMYFLDTIIALKGDLKCFGVEIHKTKDEKFNPMEFNLQFRLEPLRTGLRLAYKEDTETKTYQFYNFINTVAELKIKKSQPEQVTYTRKIGFKNRQWVPYWIDCSRGTRIVYSGDLYGNGQVALIKA